MLVIKSYQFSNQKVDLTLSTGKIATIYLTAESGLVYCRSKIGTLSDVKHAGIFLGQDVAGNRYFMHNHYKTGQPAIVSQSEFTQGLLLYLYEGKSTNTPQQTVQLGLEQVMTAEPYSWHSYNCQTFVNHARSNQRISEDVNRWVAAILFAFLLLIGIKSINK